MACSKNILFYLNFITRVFWTKFLFVLNHPSFHISHPSEPVSLPLSQNKTVVSTRKLVGVQNSIATTAFDYELSFATHGNAKISVNIR